MIPLFDNVPARRPPLVNYTLIGLNVLVFLWEVGQGPRLDEVFRTYGVVPAVFVASSGLERWLPVFTSMFLHGGVWHLVSNMLALWIFGDNVEDRMGHFRYLVFYLLCGVAASLVHIYTDPTSTIPSVGASGAISGVLAAYLVMFPMAYVYTLIPLFFWVEIVAIPALIYLGLWFLSQLVNGLFALSATSLQSAGGIAWWAHIGGFVAGLILVWIFRRREDRRVYADEHWPY